MRTVGRRHGKRGDHARHHDIDRPIERLLMSSNPDDDEKEEEEVIITVPVDQQAGVWANWAAINESDHEFTIDFARVDHSVTPNVGIVVARVGMSPRMLRQLLDRLDVAWSSFTDNLAEELRDADDGRPEEPEH